MQHRMLFSAQLLLEIKAYFSFEVMSSCRRCLSFWYVNKEVSKTCWESKMSFPHTPVLVLKGGFGYLSPEERFISLMKLWLYAASYIENGVTPGAKQSLTFFFFLLKPPNSCYVAFLEILLGLFYLCSGLELSWENQIWHFSTKVQTAGDMLYLSVVCNGTSHSE